MTDGEAEIMAELRAEATADEYAWDRRAPSDDDDRAAQEDEEEGHR